MIFLKDENVTNFVTRGSDNAYLIKYENGARCNAMAVQQGRGTMKKRDEIMG